MDPGKLRHLVTLQQPSETTTGGETARSWSDVAEVSAAIEPISSREYFLASQPRADVTHRVTIRYRAGIQSTRRIVWKEGNTTRTLNLLGPPIDREERHAWLELMCGEAES
jgi:SPP1 family predicted phage head-tail adaptor